jgi:ATP-dependent RNA helicase DDX54/DBP10
VEPNVDWVNRVLEDSEDIAMLRRVSVKAEKLYIKTRNSSSASSAKRAREMVSTRAWSELHPLFDEEKADKENAREAMLAQISGFKPQEAIFEVGPSGKSEKNRAAEAVRGFRTRVAPRRITAAEREKAMESDSDDSDKEGEEHEIFEDEDEVDGVDGVEEEDEDDEEELEVTVSNTVTSKKGQTKESFQDSEVFMSYTPRTLNAAEERGYGVHSGSTANFITAARDVTMDLTNDDGAKAFGEPTRSKMRWDKKLNKYVSRDNDEDGTRGAKMVRGESGVKIAASFSSGRFDRWRKANRLERMPHVGETENAHHARQAGAPSDRGARYKHKKEQAPKEADKFRDDYHVRKKRVAEAKEKRIGIYRDGAGSTKEIKSADDIRKARAIMEQKKAKNARPEAKRGRKKPSQKLRR